MKEFFRRFLSTAVAVAALAGVSIVSGPSAAAAGDGIYITPLTTLTVEFAARNVKTTAVEQKGLPASRISINEDLDVVDEGNFTFPGHHDNRARLMAPDRSVSLSGSDGIVFYVDVPSANKICFVAGIYVDDEERWAKDFDPDIMQRVGESYQVLPDGSATWENRTAGKGNKNDQNGWGCVEFTSTFKGYVYIPWTSLYSDIGFEMHPSQDTLKFASIYPNKVGGDAGALTFGPVYLSTADGERLGSGGGNAITEAPTTASTEAPTTASTEAPTTTPTEAPTTAPKETSTTVSAEPSAATSAGSAETGLPAGAIAAIVIGIVIVLAGAGAAVYFLVIRKKQGTP